MRRIGVVVNPIAGMGGRVGLKGTDGKVEAARERGAEPRAPARARAALDALAETDERIEVYTAGGVMGEAAAREAGFEPVIVSRTGGDEHQSDAPSDTESDAPSDTESDAPSDTESDEPSDTESALPETTAGDTRAAVRAFVDQDVDLVLFVGGDGTAVDVAETLSEVDSEIPILGVPAGVKIYSSVFAVRPREAGIVAGTFTDVETGEVNDVDEDEYREQSVSTELRAIARTPVAEQRQASKQTGGGTVETLAEGFAADVESGVTYVLGPGGTLGAIKAQIGFEGTPLGVDVVRDGEVLLRDAGAEAIEAALGERNVVVVSPIGGQGFVFGRGNQQISPAVIRRSEVEIVASRSKLDDLDVLRVDTGDPELDRELRGWQRVRVGRYERRLVKIE